MFFVRLTSLPGGGAVNTAVSFARRGRVTDRSPSEITKILKEESVVVERRATHSNDDSFRQLAID